jgi:hypothetical protein
MNLVEPEEKKVREKRKIFQNKKKPSKDEECYSESVVEYVKTS